MNTQLTENDVVDRVCAFLEEHNWEIESRATTAERGVDIAAVQVKRRLNIEAKGATSASSASARFGKPFTRNQVFSHVSKAVFTAAAVVSDNDDILSAVAFPDTSNHRDFVQRIATALLSLEIGVFWVGEARVELSAPWTVVGPPSR